MRDICTEHILSLDICIHPCGKNIFPPKCTICIFLGLCSVWVRWVSLLEDQMMNKCLAFKGHSGHIGNTSNLEGTKIKMSQMFPMHIWYWFEFLTMKKAKGKLRIDYCIFSPPYFGTWCYPNNIVIMFYFNFKPQVPKMRKKSRIVDW